MSGATADDLLRAAGALRDEATMLDLRLIHEVPVARQLSASLGYGLESMAGRRDSLKRAAAFLDQHAGVMHCAPAQGGAACPA